MTIIPILSKRSESKDDVASSLRVTLFIPIARNK